jgi:hypothetical protein
VSWLVLRMTGNLREKGKQQSADSAPRGTITKHSESTRTAHDRRPAVNNNQLIPPRGTITKV